MFGRGVARVLCPPRVGAGRLFSVTSVRNPPRAISQHSKYERVFKEAVNPNFWKAAADSLYWHKPYDRVFHTPGSDDTHIPDLPEHHPDYTWFKGGMTNTCYNALDWHVDHEARGDRLALVHDSAVTGVIQRFTYAELLDQVMLCAGVLKGLGVQKGDRVLLYMPMVPEAAVAMLACQRIGAIHSVVFGGFAAPELKKRIDDAQPTAVVTASCGVEPGKTINYKELLDKAIDLSEHKPKACVVVQRPQFTAPLTPGRDVEWGAAMAAAERVTECTWVESSHPSYILYTSGTTGAPKGIVRDTGGHAAALKWSMKNIYNMEAGDVWWAASDIGWVVGHSYIVYAPLLAGCTTVMYEGKPGPNFWRIIQDQGVRGMFTAPTAFRAMRREDPEGLVLAEYDVSALKYLFLAGERADPSTIQWAEDLFKNQVPIIDHYWQTESGYPIVATCTGLGRQKYKLGSSGRPVPGYNLKVLDSLGEETPPGETGSLALKLPLPPGVMKTLWNRPQLAVDTYFKAHPGYYNLGDSGYVDEEGFVFIMSRTDDVVNCAGHRLSTGAIEEVLAQHPDVAECCSFGVADELKGHVPVGLVVLKSGHGANIAQVQKSVLDHCRHTLGAVYHVKDCIVVQRLPKTRSGKILRNVLRKMADGEAYTLPGTIEDPSVIPEVAGTLQEHGFPGKGTKQGK